MKSLEHIIREIREGKGVKGEKSSLEHSIRKVVKQSLLSLIEQPNLLMKLLELLVQTNIRAMNSSQ
jgi:hypothetical protein